MKRERWHAQRDGEGATCLRLPRRYARNDNFFLSPSDMKSGSADDFHYHVEFELPAQNVVCTIGVVTL